MYKDISLEAGQPPERERHELTSKQVSDDMSQKVLSLLSHRSV